MTCDYDYMQKITGCKAIRDKIRDEKMEDPNDKAFDQKFIDNMLADDPAEKPESEAAWRMTFEPKRENDFMQNERGRALCEEALKVINGERQNQYGHPEDSFSAIATLWQGYLRTAMGDEDLEISATDVALMMVLLKIARIMGQGRSEDSYVDAIGYLALAGEM